MDQAEASGKTVEDALNKALAKLGATREQVELTVLDEGKRGFLGRGGRDALVRIERIAGAAPAPAHAELPDTRIPHAPAAGTQREGARRRGGRGRGGRSESSGQGAHPEGERPQARGGRGGRGGGGAGGGSRRAGYEPAAPKLTDADFTRPPSYDEEVEVETPSGGGPKNGGRRGGHEHGGERHDRTERPRGERRHREEMPHISPDINAPEVDFAAQTVDDLLRILDIDAEISIREPLTPGDGLGSVLAVIDISGEDLGLLIGRRGETLLSMQYLVNLVLSKHYPGKGGVTIDVEHYRHRNEERITALAKRMAERVRETGAPITLEPMSAAERRLVHLMFADDPELETNSVGEGEHRKVVISSRR